MNTAPNSADQDTLWQRTNWRPEHSTRRTICLFLLCVHRLQTGAFGNRLTTTAGKAFSPSIYQELLLNLYLAELENKPVYQSWLAPAGPPATVHRQVARLEALGAVSRSPNADDHRRMNVTLTPGMLALLDDFMDAIATEVREYFCTST